MPERARSLAPPRGLARLLFRVPILLYRLGLGWLLGRRFVLLSHRGRRTGQWHQTVLEVVGEQRESGLIRVVSAWGERSDWLRNVRVTPEVKLQIGRRRMKAEAQPLEHGEGAEVLCAYAKQHPVAARALAGLFGYRLRDVEHDFGQLAHDVVVVSLHARD